MAREPSAAEGELCQLRPMGGNLSPGVWRLRCGGRTSTPSSFSTAGFHTTRALPIKLEFERHFLQEALLPALPQALRLVRFRVLAAPALL